MTIMVIEIEMELSRRKLRFFGRFISSVEREFCPPSSRSSRTARSPGAEVTESDIVIAGDAAHIALGDRREERHHQPGGQRAGKHQLHALEARHR